MILCQTEATYKLLKNPKALLCMQSAIIIMNSRNVTNPVSLVNIFYIFSCLTIPERKHYLILKKLLVVIIATNLIGWSLKWFKKWWNFGTANVSHLHTDECFKVFLYWGVLRWNMMVLIIIIIDKMRQKHIVWDVRSYVNCTNDVYQNNTGIRDATIEHFKIMLW